MGSTVQSWPRVDGVRCQQFGVLAGHGDCMGTMEDKSGWIKAGFTDPKNRIDRIRRATAM